MDFPKGLAKPAQRALAGAGFEELEQLANVSEDEVMKLHGMGRKALGLLRNALAEQGLAFKESS